MTNNCSGFEESGSIEETFSMCDTERRRQGNFALAFFFTIWVFDLAALFAAKFYFGL